jgi:hypothetical protein
MDAFATRIESVSEDCTSRSPCLSPVQKSYRAISEMLPRAGITIIAASSPDIQALNLPTTPSFPAEFGYGFGVSFNPEMEHAGTPFFPSPQNDASHGSFEISARGGLTIVAASSPDMDAVNRLTTPSFPPMLRFDFDSTSHHETIEPNILFQEFLETVEANEANCAQALRDRFSCFSDTGEDDSSGHAFCSPPSRMNSLEESTGENREDSLLYHQMGKMSFLNHPDQDDENIHPNGITPVKPSQKGRKSLVHMNGKDEYFIVMEKKHFHSGRKALHRRDSMNSLPSPEEIGPSPKTPRRCNVSASQSVVLFSD